MSAEEIVDIAAVDRYAPVISPIAADRIDAPKISPVEAIAAVVFEICLMMRRVRAQPIQFSEFHIALAKDLSVCRSKLSESDLATDEQLSHVAIQDVAMAIENGLETPDPQLVTDIPRDRFKFAMNQRRLENSDPLAFGEHTKHELV